MKRTLLALVLLASGCAPTGSFKRMAPSPLPLPETCSLFELQPGDTTLRSTVRLGSVSVGGILGFICEDKRYESAVGVLRRTACTAGADLYRITREVPPDFLHDCWRIDAEAYAFTDPWPRCESPLDSLAFRRAMEDSVAPGLEGIWWFRNPQPWSGEASSRDTSPVGKHRLALIATDRFPPHSHAAVVLDDELPGWRPGDVKALLDFDAATDRVRGLWFGPLFDSLRVEWTLRDSAAGVIDSEIRLTREGSATCLVSDPFIPLERGSTWCYRMFFVEADSGTYTIENRCLASQGQAWEWGEHWHLVSGSSFRLMSTPGGMVLGDEEGSRIFLRYPVADGEVYRQPSGDDWLTITVSTDSVRVPAGVYPAVTYLDAENGLSLSVSPGVGIVRCVAPGFLAELVSFERIAP